MRTTVARRVGFTLVELLVVIAIIGMLVALLIPAVQAARATARQTQCLNNTKQLMTAVINYETSKQRYPGYVQSVPRAVTGTTDKYQLVLDNGGLANTRFGNSAPNANPNVSRVSWAAVILPYMERQDIWDRMVDGQFDDQPVPVLELLGCPADSDLTSIEGNAGISYSANAGAWDWDTGNNFLTPNNTRPGDTKDNGLFMNRSLGKVQTRMSGMPDGSGNTILLSENIHKDTAYSWMGVAPDQQGEQHFGLVWVVSQTPTTDSNPMARQAPLSNEFNATDFDSTKPWFARPASNHSGGTFNVAFAGGNATSIDPSIDYTVYQRLMTPNGKKCVDPSGTVADNQDPIRAFRNLPLLSEKDYQ